MDDGPEYTNLQGTQPLHDADIDSLANERTLFAWVRTGFTLVATGALVLHFSDFRLVPRELIIGTGTIALGVLVWCLGYVRFRAGERAILNDDHMISVTTVRIVALAVSVAATGALLIALLSPS